MKDDLSQKNTWKYDIFFKCSEKMVFSKKSHWNMIFKPFPSDNFNINRKKSDSDKRHLDR